MYLYIYRNSRSRQFSRFDLGRYQIASKQELKYLLLFMCHDLMLFSDSAPFSFPPITKFGMFKKHPRRIQDMYGGRGAH